MAADIVIGIGLQVMRSSLERPAAPDLTTRALNAVLRALGVAKPDDCMSSSVSRLADFGAK